MLRVEEARIAVGNRVVVEKATLWVGRGEVHFILGPNGSGKTSLLSVIAGVPGYRVVSGRIVFMDRDLAGTPPWERARAGIALAHQLPPQMRYLRGRVLVEEMARKYGVEKRIVEALAEKLRVGELLGKRLFRDMSGGERKRLELFLALLQKPKLLLLDEPDSGVDVDTIELVAAVIVETASSGAGVVVVSHTPLLARRVVSWGAENATAHVMCRGRLVYTGPAHRVFSLVESRGFGWAEGCRSNAG